MISEEIKKIYNTYLSASRKARNKPYKLRSDFENFENKVEYNILIKLEHFFKRFPNIDKDTFFTAPYMIWKDKDYFGLEFFVTPAATRAYTLYKKQMLENDPDSEDSLNYIRNSLMFIAKYCKENNISLDNYYVCQTGATFDWMKHIRNGNISPYVVFGFKNIDNILYKTPEDERDLLLGDFSNKFYIYKEKYNKSKLAKQLVLKGLDRIKGWSKQ